MKLTALFLLMALFKVNAEGIAQRVTLSERNSSLESVFQKITGQTGYVFFYNDKLLKGANMVSVDVKNVPLETALKLCLHNQRLSYIISNKTIAVRALDNRVTIITQKRNLDTLSYFVPIKGRVIDSKTGNPVVGASVTVKQANIGTIVDKSGEFRLSVVGAATLVVSFVGYETQEVNISGGITIIVKLVQSSQLLKETVVTGIVNRKASSYTGSVITLSNEDLRKVGNANVFQALKNISPSLVLDNFSMGSNPNTIPDLQLRGTSTFPPDQSARVANLKGNYERNPNAPLFILDGFETSSERIYDLDINRIESVTILKDAASKAIYGSEAANGVVVIETKKIATESGALISYNGSVDVDMADLSSFNLTNSLEKLEAETIDGMYTTFSSDPETRARLAQLYNSRRKLALEGLNTDWIAKPLREGIGQRHTLTAEVASGNLNVVANLAYRNIQGIMKGSDRTMSSGDISTSYRVKNFLFRNVLSANKNRSHDSPYGTFSEYAVMNPYWRAVNVDGSIPFYAEVSYNNTQYANPLYNSTVKSKINNEYFQFTDNFYLIWTITPGLRAQARVGIDNKTSSADEFYPSSHTKFGTSDYSSEEMKKRRGSYQVNNGKMSQVAGDLNITYTKEAGPHVYTVNGRFNISEAKYSEVLHKVEGFSSDRMDNIIFGRQYQFESRPQGIDGITRDLGFLGTASYTYDNRFLSDLTLRTNASSQFGTEKKWANFWSVGLGWNLHNEKFMQRFRFVEQFKLRASVGSTGNSNFQKNTSIATYNYYQQSLYQGFPGSYLANLANTGLQWETKMDYNIGFDARIHRLNMRFDYYESFTENLITDITIPNSTGFSSVKENLGKVKNSGFEIYGTYTLWAKGRNFINMTAGLETNKNKIIELSNAMKSFNARMDLQAANKGTSTPVKRYVDGMSMNAIWAVQSLGIDPSTGKEVYLKKDGSTTYEWSASDLIVAGDSYSPYQGVLGFGFEINGIGMNVTGRYMAGGQLYNQTLVDKVENVDMNYNVDKRVLTGRWRYAGQNAQFKRLGTYAVNAEGAQAPEKTRATTRFVQDRNEVTIGAVNVYYLFNNRVLDKMGLRRLKLAFNMNEIGTISSIKIERGTLYPYARTMSFSISTTF